MDVVYYCESIGSITNSSASTVVSGSTSSVTDALAASYSLGWVSDGKLNTTTSASCTATLTWLGTAVQVVGTVGPQSGPFSCDIDGGTYFQSYNGWSETSQTNKTLCQIEGLAKLNHTLVVSGMQIPGFDLSIEQIHANEGITNGNATFTSSFDKYTILPPKTQNRSVIVTVFYRDGPVILIGLLCLILVIQWSFMVLALFLRWSKKSTNEEDEEDEDEEEADDENKKSATDKSNKSDDKFSKESKSKRQEDDSKSNRSTFKKENKKPNEVTSKSGSLFGPDSSDDNSSDDSSDNSSDDSGDKKPEVKKDNKPVKQNDKSIKKPLKRSSKASSKRQGESSSESDSSDAKSEDTRSSHKAPPPQPKPKDNKLANPKEKNSKRKVDISDSDESVGAFEQHTWAPTKPGQEKKR